MDLKTVLAESGLKRNEASVLFYLFEHGNKGYSREVERKMDLRQPEVSQAMSNFSKKGWLKKKTIERKAKGRPMFLYKLTKSKAEIIKELQGNIQKKIDELEKIVKELGGVC